MFSPFPLFLLSPSLLFPFLPFSLSLLSLVFHSFSLISLFYLLFAPFLLFLPFNFSFSSFSPQSSFPMSLPFSHLFPNSFFLFPSLSHFLFPSLPVSARMFPFSSSSIRFYFSILSTLLSYSTLTHLFFSLLFYKMSNRSPIIQGL